MFYYYTIWLGNSAVFVSIINNVRPIISLYPRRFGQPGDFFLIYFVMLQYTYTYTITTQYTNTTLYLSIRHTLACTLTHTYILNQICILIEQLECEVQIYVKQILISKKKANLSMCIRDNKYNDYLNIYYILKLTRDI